MAAMPEGRETYRPAATARRCSPPLPPQHAGTSLQPYRPYRGAYSIRRLCYSHRQAQGVGGCCLSPKGIWQEGRLAGRYSGL